MKLVRMAPLRICLVDMNNGVANQATRCFRRICDGFTKRVRAENPGVEVTFRHVQPRNLGELPDLESDLVLSSGGPGAPTDGFDDPWCVGYRKFLDDVMAANTKAPETSTKLLLVCHSFEIGVLHFDLADVKKRPTTKFGVMPAYITKAGQELPYLQPFGYRLFTWEHRNWEVVNLDARKLARMGGALTATESHARSKVNSGDAVIGLTFGPGVDGTQFHPEADKPGVLAWIEKPEHASAVTDAYGRTLYEKMIATLSNPDRLARTFALLIPGWLTHRFNELAPARGWRPLPPPEFDMQEFDVAV